MEQIEPIKKIRRYVEFIVLISLILIYGLSTYQRNFIWKDDITLWSDCAKKSPMKARPHNNLAVFYNGKNLTEQAITEAIIALKLRQNYPNPFISLGDAYLKKGSPDMAIMAYKNAISIKSDYADAYFSMGNAYAKKGEMDLAIETFKKALKLRPNDITVRVNLAVAYGSKGLTDQAIAGLQYALTIKSDSPDIHYNLGVAYEQLAISIEHGEESGELIVNAINEYKKTLMLNPDDFQAKERMTKLIAKSKEQ